MTISLLRRATASILVISLFTAQAFAEKNSEKQAPEKASASDRAAEKASEKDAKDEKKMENRSAQEIADLVKDLDYPELQVVPRASDRLKMEARDEGRGWYVSHWPIQLSGLATLITSAYGKNKIRQSTSDPNEQANFENQADRILLVGELIGAGWSIGGVLWGLRKPYRNGLAEINKIQGKDVRSQLMRERLAEESLEAPAKLVQPLKYASVFSNLAISLLIANFLNDEGRVIALGSATLAFLPLIYEDPAVYTWEKHEEYKRKIYGPVSTSGFTIDHTTHKLIPTAGLVWNF